MRELTFTLISDGSSDRALLPILTWLLRQHLPDFALNGTWADFRHVTIPSRKLEDRLERVWKLFPCELLFIHRDAERETVEKRRQEIQMAFDSIGRASTPWISVVPVRMLEAWLLHNEPAIRKAAGNPAGTMPLQFPLLRTVEQIPDPKEELYGLLKKASGLSGRRLQRFRPQSGIQRIAELIEDYSPLRQLIAFQTLEGEIAQWSSAQRASPN